MEWEYQEYLSDVAQETIDTFERIAANSRSRIHESQRTLTDALANAGSVRVGMLETLDQIDKSEREACHRLSIEPAIARVVADDGERGPETIFISRSAAPAPFSAKVKLASYRSPKGRLAALAPGDCADLVIAGKTITYEVLERATFHPEEKPEGWDARDSIFQKGEFDPIVIDSLRRLLVLGELHGDAADEIARLLIEEEIAQGALRGHRKTIITKMVLRDQPVLDRFQDEIFRLPIDSQLAVFGPPGTGKTTTLIRRLGQKLDLEHLQPAELALVERLPTGRREPHSRSWLMFTPTELLRHYVKEAFAREGIAASDYRIRTWSNHRRELARNQFRILKTRHSGGPFVLAEDRKTLAPAASEQAIGWFEDFDRWQWTKFWEEIGEAAATLKGSANARLATLGGTLERALEVGGRARGMAQLIDLANLVDDVPTMLDALRETAEGQIRMALNVQYAWNRKFIDELSAFIDGLAGRGEDSDEDESTSTDEADEPVPQTRRAVAIRAYHAAIRTQARMHVLKRPPGAGQSAEIIKWLGDRGLPEGKRQMVGQSLIDQTILRRLLNPIRAYLDGIPHRYRTFRRARRAEGKWYDSRRAGTYINGLECDLILLSTLRSVVQLLSDPRISRARNNPSFAFLENISAMFCNQILVDEATDFSPVQLACMFSLSEPTIQSFFLCGDFNQRVTSSGIRSADDLRWVHDQIHMREIGVCYRQSQQLLDLARAVASVTSGLPPAGTLPTNVDNKGAPPVLAEGLGNKQELVSWLVERIVEIETAGRPRSLPSTAILVDCEAEVQPLAAALDAALQEHNLSAVACLNGQIIGQDNEVRVIDVHHIKGLEFEAIFFIGIDRLAISDPTLFERYLYVGATRAATYLGLACAGPLPTQLDYLRDHMGSSWQPTLTS